MRKVKPVFNLAFHDGRSHKRLRNNLNVLICYAFIFSFCAKAALSAPVVRVPIETMQKVSSHIIILAPETFTTESVCGRRVAHYKYAAIKYLKGDNLGSELVIFDYPEGYDNLLTTAFTGSQGDSLPNGIKREDCIDILFLYKDTASNRLYWIPFMTPNCFPLRKYLGKIQTLQDLIQIAEVTRDPGLIGFIASITCGSTDIFWRGRVDAMAKKLGGEEEAMFAQLMSSSPVAGVEGNIEDLVPDIRERYLKTLESSVRLVLSGFFNAVLSANLRDAMDFCVTREESISLDSHETQQLFKSPAIQRIQRLGVLTEINVTSVKHAGDFVDVTGTINGNDGPMNFTLSLTRDKMKIFSLAIDSKKL